MFIDRFPDLSFYAILSTTLLIEILIGVSPAIFLPSLSVMGTVFAITLATNIVLKNVFRTPRPRSRYISRSVFSPSFPSLHAQFSTSEAAALATCIYALAPQHLRLLATTLAAAVAGGSAAVVSWSRVRVGAHRVVDVVGAAAMGVPTGMVLAIALLPEVIREPIAINALIAATFLVSILILSTIERRKLVNG